jgi:hypothetical protein
LNPLIPAPLKRGLGALAGLGLLALIVGAAKGLPGVWGGFLIAYYLFIGLGLAGIVFIAIQYAAKGRWATQIRRVPEAMAQTLLVSGSLVLLLLWAAPHIYPWADPDHFKDPSLASKKFYFSMAFYSIRSIVYVLGWIILSQLILRQSRKQDVDGLAIRTTWARRLSMGFLIFFAYSFWLSMVDWIGSLEVDWASTIYGVYGFAGIMQSGFAAIILLVLWLEKRGALKGVREEQLFDLGKFMFAFSAFWAYMWFSQYMLTWYADMPEENKYYLLRSGPWAYIMAAVVVGRFLVPFFGLASQANKRSRGRLAAIAGSVLFFHWLDVFMMVMPPQTHGEFGLSPFTVLLPLAFLAEFFLLFNLFFSKQNPVPVKDPGLAYSQHYH